MIKRLTLKRHIPSAGSGPTLRRSFSGRAPRCNFAGQAPRCNFAGQAPRCNFAGFTLIELLLVIVIIGILATLATVAVNNTRAKARDAKRVADLKQISTALELYYADHNSYPSLITPNQPLLSANGSKTYLAKIPSNPTPRAEGSCSDIDYQYYGSGNIYNLYGCLAKDVSDIKAGQRILSSGGVQKNSANNSGLIGWWLFDAVNGAKDLSGSNKNGVLTNITTSTGRYGETGGSFAYNNSTSITKLSSHILTMPYTGDLSISFWIKLNSIGDDVFFDYRDSSGDGLVIFTSTANKYIKVNWNNFTAYTTNDILTLNTWQHITVVITQGGMPNIYINGTEATYALRNTFSGNLDATNFLGIGALNYSSTSWVTDGYMADVRLYNRALSSTEASNLYEATKP